MTMGLPTIASYELPGRDELPGSRLGWKVEAARAALLIHDMQAYFLRPFDHRAAPFKPLIDNIARLRSICRHAGLPVFYTAQQGGQDRRDRGLQADLWGPGMDRSAEHEAIHDAIAPGPSEIVLHKHRYSAFQRSTLEALMRARGRDQLIICGVYAHIGCMLTAAEAFQRDIQPFFVADGLADFSRPHHMQALDYIASTCGMLATVEGLEGTLTQRIAA
ncbi:bifunctional isochorismate lyase / aryl carrier protein [Afifella marina DSM 2698]|uniref:Bifunctional isochorismate lyase / aryl carrier protein n=2 Tax=Afifella marina TaxID=1080 RepID=A0A1G5NTK9_AFIMA|nr:bifunctional isochorismate lyase / aryl carrier protein [Afifella marina DSM 2698]